MPFNGSGSHSLPEAPIENGQTADADVVQSNFDDISDGLTGSLRANGEKPAAANQPMGGFRHTDVGAATLRTMYARTDQVADSSLTYGGVAGGTANALTFAPSPAIAAYALGQRFFGIVGATANSGAVTINVNSVGAGPLRHPDGTALSKGDLPPGAGIDFSVVDISSPTAPVFHLQTPMRALAFIQPGHRLTLTTALAVTTADVTAATTVYWSPWKHNQAPICDGTSWRNRPIAELSFILDATNMVADKNFDVLLEYNSGTPRLVLSPAWTTDTARADALGVDATFGYVVNNASMTVRLSNNGGTATLAAKAGLYLGTIRTSANGQTEDSLAKRYVWNRFNAVPRAMRGALETADSWTYSTATIRQANNNAANQLDFVRGLDEDAIEVTAAARWANGTVAGAGVTLIGLDSTSAAVAGCIMVGASAGAVDQILFSQASWRGVPGLGRHVLTWLEMGNGTGVQTWSGDGSNATFIQSGITGWGMA